MILRDIVPYYPKIERKLPGVVYRRLASFKRIQYKTFYLSSLSSQSFATLYVRRTRVFLAY